jgi:hypothetical protein
MTSQKTTPKKSKKRYYLAGIAALFAICYASSPYMRGCIYGFLDGFCHGFAQGWSQSPDKDS